MSEFDFLDTITNNKQSSNIPKNTKCSHLNYKKEKNTWICYDCGEEIPTPESELKTKNSSKHVLDPTRCQIRKNEDKNIYKDVEKLNFHESTIEKANDIFLQVTKKKIYRGNSRKAIIFACIFHAYKLENNPQSPDSLIKIFGLQRKVGLKGLNHVGLNLPKDSQIKNTYITVEDIIKEILINFSANQKQIDEVIDIYESIKNKSSILNRSRPQSTGAGVIFYYILLKNKDIRLKEFSKKVGLSELTIQKMTKEISKILNTPEIA